MNAMSRMQRELNQLLKTRELIERAIVAESAIAWLDQYGPKGPSENDTISAAVSQNYASSCPGKEEARRYLEMAIQQSFGEISQLAVLLAQADIDLARGTLDNGAQP